MTQHTPGPWKTIYAPGQAGAYYLSAPDGVIGLINISGADEKLICAAPDLLAALRQWAEYAEQNGGDEAYSFNAATRAAISRATGGAQ